jgi:hypothetical protein
MISLANRASVAIIHPYTATVRHEMLNLVEVISAGPELISAGDTAAGTAIPAKSSVPARGMASGPSSSVPKESVALAVKTPRS